jgi:hypothetical protein
MLQLLRVRQHLHRPATTSSSSIARC